MRPMAPVMMRRVARAMAASSLWENRREFSYDGRQETMQSIADVLDDDTFKERGLIS